MNRFDFTPDAARTAKIWNPGLGTDTSPAEHNAIAAGAEWCEVEDLETHTTYRAKIDTILEKGVKFNYGWGDQVRLELGAFIQHTKPVQLSLLDEMGV